MPGAGYYPMNCLSGQGSDALGWHRSRPKRAQLAAGFAEPWNDFVQLRDSATLFDGLIRGTTVQPKKI
jgi:hypothetical protein